MEKVKIAKGFVLRYCTECETTVVVGKTWKEAKVCWCGHTFPVKKSSTKKKAK